MTIAEKALQIQKLAMEISAAKIASANTDYFGDTQNLMVTVHPLGTFSTQRSAPVAILQEDIDLQPTRWITEEHIHQQLDFTLEQLQLIKCPAQGRGEAA